MLTLFYVPRTRSSRPRWLLEEMGLTYDMVRVDPKSKPEGYEELHPLGHVPVLRDGDFAMFESSAICIYLAEKDERFVPAPGTAERAHYYQWMFYAMTELEPQVILVASEQRVAQDKRDAGKIERATAAFASGCAGLSRALGQQEYLLGKFTALDVVVGSVLIWARAVGILPKDQVALDAYCDRLAARPAATRARAD